VSPGPNLPALWWGVNERLEATLRACGIAPDAVEALPPTPIVVPPGTPDPPRTRRHLRKVRIRAVPPGMNLFASATDLWQRGGCQVHETVSVHGSTLVAHDPAGYVLTLTPDLLVVASPLVPAEDHGLAIGIVVGAVLGPISACTTAISSLPDGNGVGWLQIWAWLPVLIVVSGLLMISPKTRRFAAGLAIGCACTGIATSGLCTNWSFG
jgi:hypothetical protein